MIRRAIIKPTVLQQLVVARKALKKARAELAKIRASIRVPRSDQWWSPATDLKRQFSQALTDLDSAIDNMTPMPEHLDQQQVRKSAAQAVGS